MGQGEVNRLRVARVDRHTGDLVAVDVGGHRCGVRAGHLRGHDQPSASCSRGGLTDIFFNI